VLTEEGMSYTNHLSYINKLHSFSITGTCPKHAPYQHKISCSIKQQRRKNTHEIKGLHPITKENSVLRVVNLQYPKIWFLRLKYINRACERIKEIQKSQLKTVDLSERKQHKPWFDEKCSKFFDQRST
jgi:hypothetical protein